MSSTSSSRDRNGARCPGSAMSRACRRDRRSRVERARWRRLGLGLGDEDLAVRAVPGRDLVAPPELARDAPGLDVLHPVEIGLLPVLRHEDGAALAHRRDRAAAASVLASTYHWSVRKGSITTPERSPCGTMWRVRLDLLEQARRLQARDDAACARRSGRGRAAQRLVELRRRRHVVEEGLVVREIELGLDVEHVDQRQVVAAADLEIVEVVRRRDLDRAGALLRIGIFVGDDRDAAADQRQDRVLADRCR